MKQLITVRAIPLCVLLFLAFGIANAEAQRLNVSLKVTEVTVTGGVADATLAVEVHNEESVAANNVWVIFEDGTEASIGDVPAEGSAASAESRYTFDLSGKLPTLNVPLPVTLKFSIEGTAGEKPAVAILRTVQQ
jgi:hypothetical protein